MGQLEERVAIVTGAGRGLGRDHALYLAGRGARVVVNDIGVTATGGSLADGVVDEITAAGGQAVASDHDVSDWQAAAELVNTAVSEFGELHVLVNNAGIVRDRTLARMSEREWDDVLRVNLKGHAAPTAHALAYWRLRAKETGAPVSASVVHTTSIGGLMGNFGQANYTAAKLGVVGLSLTAALEGTRIGVRSNAIAPSARTPLTATTGSPVDIDVSTPEGGGFDFWDPGNVSPVVGWLAETDCSVSGQILQIAGNRLMVFSMPSAVHEMTTEGRWTSAALSRCVPDAAAPLPDIADFLTLQAEHAREGSGSSACSP